MRPLVHKSSERKEKVEKKNISGVPLLFFFFSRERVVGNLASLCLSLSLSLSLFQSVYFLSPLRHGFVFVYEVDFGKCQRGGCESLALDFMNQEKSTRIL